MFGLLAETSTRLFTVDQVLSPYIYVFYTAYIVTFLFTPVMRSIARHYHIIDEPDGLRKMHRTPVAYLGGVAVFLGWLSGLAMSQFLTMYRISDAVTKSANITPNPAAPTTVIINFSIVIAACVIVLLGLWDDVLRMSPWKKIAGQVFAAACLLASGIGTHSAWMFIQPILIRTSRHLQWPVADPTLLNTHLIDHQWLVVVPSVVFVIAVVVLCCNAANLMDGLDGLCGGVTAIVVAGFLFLALSVAASRTSDGTININQDALRIVLGLALLGAVLAFVPSNFNPASIFLGDAGSMFVGFACATMAVLFAGEGRFNWFIGAMVMFSLPILDTALAFVRRWVNGRPIFSPDRYHFHHQLVARGFTVRQTVLISYALTVFFCLLGAAVVFVRVRYAVAIYLVVFGSMVVAAVKMGMVHERVKAVSRKPLGVADAGSVPQEMEPGAVLEVRDEVAEEKAAEIMSPDAWAETATRQAPQDLSR